MSNSEQTKFNARDFWANIAHWLEGVNIQKNPQEHIQNVHQWYDAFLESFDADDMEIRLEVRDLRDDLINFFTILDGLSPEERNEQIKSLAV